MRERGNLEFVTKPLRLRIAELEAQLSYKQSQLSQAKAERDRLANGLMTHEGAEAFWKVWKEVGEPHKHGFYESTWRGFRAAFETEGKIQLAAHSQLSRLKDIAGEVVESKEANQRGYYIVDAELMCRLSGLLQEIEK